MNCHRGHFKLYTYNKVFTCQFVQSLFVYMLISYIEALAEIRNRNRREQEDIIDENKTEVNSIY